MKNDYGIEYKGSNYLQNKLQDYEIKVYSVCGVVFGCIGTMNLVVLLCVFAKTNFRRMIDVKKAVFVLPMLIYNFGTMLLLTGQDFRFFYFSFLVTPVIAVLMLRSEEDTLGVAK